MLDDILTQIWLKRMGIEELKKLDKKVTRCIFLEQEDIDFLKENYIHLTWFVRTKIAEEKKKRRLR